MSPRTVRQLHAVLRRALAEAERWGLVGRNVAAFVTPPRFQRREMVTLSPEQARVFLAASERDRFHALYVVALTTGMRQGELLALRWRDVDFDTRSIMVQGSLQRVAGKLTILEPKTASSRRRIALTATAVDTLRRHRIGQSEQRLRAGPGWEDRDLVFTNSVGRPIEVTNLLRRSFRPILEEASLPRIRFHDLRHTAATLMLGRGVHPKVVAEMLGHSQISTTLDLYSHVTPTMQREATEALDEVLGS